MVYLTLNGSLTSAILFVFSLLPYMWKGNEITITLIFTLMSVLKQFRFAMQFLPNAISEIIECIVSSERILNYLITKEKE